MTYIKQGIAFLLCMAVTVLFLLYGHIFRCQTIGFSSFLQIAPGLYVSPDISAKQQHLLQQVYKHSNKRLEDFWGSKAGNATIILCAGTDEYETYCHSREGAGCSLGTPFGSSFIVLNLHGLNTDVLSHEMCHDELFARLGWWRTTFHIPQWFHEGLALMLDKRFVSESDSLLRFEKYRQKWLQQQRTRRQPSIQLEDIRTIKSFFGQGQENALHAYITAGTEVSYWLAHVGRPGLLKLMDTLAHERDFLRHYRLLESRAQATATFPVNPLR